MSVLLRVGSNAVAEGELAEVLREDGLHAACVPGGLLVSCSDTGPRPIDAATPVLAVIAGDASSGGGPDDDVDDIAVWPRDRAALPRRIQALEAGAAALRERDLYRSILDEAPFLVLVKSRIGQFLYANQALASTYGSTPEEIIGQYSVDLQRSIEARTAIDGAEAALRANGARVAYEAMLDTAAGPRCMATDLRLGAYGGEPVVIGIARDVTQERAAAAEFQRQNHLLRQVLDANPGPIVVKDEHERFVLVNAAAARLVDREAEDMIGCTASDLHDNQAEIATWVAAEQRATRARVPIVEELSFTSRDGSVLRFLATHCAFQNEDGEHRLLTMATDITARRRAEDSAEQYRALVEMSRTLALVTDLDGNIVSASRAWLVDFGYAEHVLVGTYIGDLVHPDDRQRLFGDQSQKGKVGDLDQAEVRVRSAEGNFRRLTWSVALDLHREKGYAVAHDITELRRAERVAEEARANAVQASRIKSQFLANMSHEIRTPMNGVLGMLEAILDTELTPEQREHLNDAHVSAYALLEILNDVLDISKIEAGHLALEQVPFVVREVVSSAVTPLRERARQKGLALRVFVDERVPEALLGDQLRFRQVLVNLLGNAVKFTNEGVVSLSIRRDARDADVIHVVVVDTGIGIAADKHDRIFEAFRQADESTTRTYGGTGLGLSICAELTRLMGGRIWMESEPGCGSTFHFTARLPAATLEPDSTEPSAAPAPPSSQRLRVLLVDDNAINTKLGARLLQKNGCDVTTAPNGLAAVDIVAGGGVDLVLMDVQMPVMDGLEATRRIRASEQGRRVPIVALTASAMKDDEARCLAAGMDGHLPKPLDSSQLAELVARYRGTGPRSQPSLRSRGRATVDLEAVRERCDYDRGVLEEVVSAYRESCREVFAVLDEARNDRNLSVARRAAHKLKGSFLYVSADPAAKIADQIEHLDDDGAEALTSLVGRLKAEAADVESLLLEECGRPTASPAAEGLHLGE